MADILFGPEVRGILEHDDAEEMKLFLEELHPATVAAALEGEFEVDEVWRFLSHTSIKNQAEVFEYFPIDWQVQMVEGTGRAHMAKLIEQMAPDDRAELLRKLDPAVRESLIRLVDEADRRDIATLVKYPEDTAGALMTTEYAWLPDNITVGDALDRLRLQAPDSETIYYVYVLDEQRRLIGVVSLRQLIMSPRTRLIREIMSDEVFRVQVSDDREQVAQVLARYDLLAIPVVDEQGRLVGIVTHDDVIDVVVEEATEDVHRLGGLGPMEENYLEITFFTLWRKRAFWLGMLFFAELLTIFAMASYEDDLSKLVVLSVFIPLCISIGGNSGSQAVTLITRALALGQVTLADWLRVVRHELIMGAALGLTLGIFGMACGVLVAAVRPDHGVSPWRLGFVVAQAVAAICLWGTLVGSMLPLFFKRIHIDPGVASSPTVATFVDVTGILIYFGIAQFHFADQLA